MQLQTLIRSIVQHTTILIAELATSAGLRAPLAQLAKQVFFSLSKELETQGVSRKVAADMFGLTLRSYQLKVQRLEGELVNHTPSLWEKILEQITSKPVVEREEILDEYREGRLEQAKSVLHDMVTSGVVERTKSGEQTFYQLAEESAHDDDVVLASLKWMLRMKLYREGPQTKEELQQALVTGDDELEDVLDELTDTGDLAVSPSEEGLLYSCPGHCLLAEQDDAQWTAAVFDHYHTIVTSLCVKLRELEAKSLPPKHVGGSTYSFDLWPGHPYERRVLDLLSSHRQLLSTLRQDVTAYNTAQTYPEDQYLVNFYFGQSVIKNS